MSNDTASAANIRIDRRLASVGAALTGIGTLLGWTGLSLVAIALAKAFRQWLNQLDTQPRDLAALKWRQAREATRAGTRAWRETTPERGH